MFPGGSQPVETLTLGHLMPSLSNCIHVVNTQAETDTLIIIICFYKNERICDSKFKYSKLQRKETLKKFTQKGYIFNTHINIYSISTVLKSSNVLCYVHIFVFLKASSL